MLPCSLRRDTLRRLLVATAIPARPLRFSDYLKDQNRRGAAVGPLRFDQYLTSQNRAERAASGSRRASGPGLLCPYPPPEAAAPRYPTKPSGGEREPAPPTHGLPRVPPPLIPSTEIERRVRIVYQVEIPFRPGRVIDVLT